MRRVSDRRRSRKLNSVFFATFGALALVVSLCPAFSQAWGTSNKTMGTLDLQIVPAPGEWMFFDAAQVSSLTQGIEAQLQDAGVTTSTTSLGVSVVNQNPNNVICGWNVCLSWLQLADYTLELPSEGADIVQDFYEFGLWGLAPATADVLTENLVEPDPVDIAGHVVSGTLQAVNDSDASLLSKYACMSGTAVQPEFLVGPGQDQYLNLVFDNLSIPSGESLNLTQVLSQTTYGWTSSSPAAIESSDVTTACGGSGFIGLDPETLTTPVEAPTLCSNSVAVPSLQGVFASASGGIVKGTSVSLPAEPGVPSGCDEDNVGWPTLPPSGLSPSLKSAPVVSNTNDDSPPLVGDLLSTSTGAWSNSPSSFSYQWEDCGNGMTTCSPIDGATSSTYQVQSSDIGSSLAVTVAASNSDGTSEPAWSNLLKPVPEPPAQPSISSVSSISATGDQTITISGTNFGTQAPYDGDSPYIQIADLTGGWNAGNDGTLSSGSCTTSSDGDLVTLDVTSWTNTEIVISAVDGWYGWWTFSSGDQLQVEVWNAETATGPACYNTSVS